MHMVSMLPTMIPVGNDAAMEFGTSGIPTADWCGDQFRGG